MKMDNLDKLIYWVVARNCDEYGYATIQEAQAKARDLATQRGEAFVYRRISRFFVPVECEVSEEA